MTCTDLSAVFDMASNARIECRWCVFRHISHTTILESMLKTIIEKQDDAGASTKLAPSVRWALASLSLSMLMPSLDTSIANAGLPSLARALNASFQEVQWIVLAYLLAITT